MRALGVRLGVCGVVTICEVVGVGFRMLGRWMEMRPVDVVVRAGGRPREAPPQQAHAENGDEDSRRGAQPRVQALGHDVARGVERDDSEQVDADGVGHRHHEPEEERVPGRAPRSHQVRGHDGLAVTGLERVERAQAHRHRQREQDHARAEGGAGDQGREGVARSAARVRGEAERFGTAGAAVSSARPGLAD